MDPLEQIARNVALAIDEDLEKEPWGTYTAIGRRLGAPPKSADNKLTQHLRQDGKRGNGGSLLLNVMDLLALGAHFNKKPGAFLDEYVDRVKVELGLPLDETLETDQITSEPSSPSSASGELAELLRKLDALRLPLSRHGILVDWKMQS